MTDLEVVEKALAQWVYDSIQMSTENTDRSVQSSNYQAGVSDLGHCQQKLMYLITETEPSDWRDHMAAFIGQAVGKDVEQALIDDWPDKIELDTEVVVTLEGDLRTYKVPGHPDIVGPGIVVDIKTVDGLDVVRRTGPTRAQLYQRHGYMKGLLEAGYFADYAPEDLHTANVWIDRSGRSKEVITHVDVYDPAIMVEAAGWLDEVVHAVATGTDALREQPREFCSRVCEYFTHCRGGDTDVTGIATDPAMLAAVALDIEARDLAKKAKLMSESADGILMETDGEGKPYIADGLIVNGRQVRAIYIGPVEMAPVIRKGYWRKSVGPILKPKPVRKKKPATE